MHKTLSIRDQILLIRHLASLLHAGLDLLEALHLMLESCPRNWKHILQSIIRDLNDGQGLAGSLSKQRYQFSPICINLIAIGEKTGLLIRSLTLINAQLEEQESLKRQMRQAFIYPCITLSAAAFMILAMMIWVIPSFEDIFLNFNASLPASTQLLISIARFLEAHIELILLSIISSGFIITCIWVKSERFQKLCDYHVFSFPYFGKLFRLSAQIAWCRNLAYLLDAGVSTLDSIRITAQSSNHWLIHDLSANLFKQLSQGWELGEALKRSDPKNQFFDLETKHLLHLGAKTGALGSMLHSRYQSLDSELKHQLSLLHQSLEPILVITLGLIIGGLLMTLYLPIFSLGRII